MEREIEEIVDDSPKEDSDVLPDDEQALWDSNSHEDFVKLLMDHEYENTQNVHFALKKIGYDGGLNDIPYITGRDSVPENIRAKREKRLQAYRALKQRKVE